MKKVEQGKRVSAFSAVDGSIESVIVGKHELKVTYYDLKGREYLILFHDVAELHGLNYWNQSLLSFSIGKFVEKKIDNDFYEYCFVEHCYENSYLKIKAKQMDIYQVE